MKILWLRVWYSFYFNWNDQPVCLCTGKRCLCYDHNKNVSYTRWFLYTGYDDGGVPKCQERRQSPVNIVKDDAVVNPRPCRFHFKGWTEEHLELVLKNTGKDGKRPLSSQWASCSWIYSLHRFQVDTFFNKTIKFNDKATTLK